MQLRTVTHTPSLEPRSVAFESNQNFTITELEISRSPPLGLLFGHGLAVVALQDGLVLRITSYNTNCELQVKFTQKNCIEQTKRKIRGLILNLDSLSISDLGRFYQSAGLVSTSRFFMKPAPWLSSLF